MNIHFPTDWALLVDAVRTLVKSIECIRGRGLRHRIPEPTSFLRNVNKQAMPMTASRRGRDSSRMCISKR